MNSNKSFVRLNNNIPEASTNQKLYEKVEWLLSRLPMLHKHKTYKCEAFFYGASTLIAQHLGMLQALSIKDIGWRHGVQFKENPEVKRLCFYDNLKLYLVHTKEHEHILKKESIPVKAIGAPFIYTKSKKVSRLKNSLLVMPAHAGSVSQHDWDSVQYDLAKEIQSISKNFDIIAVCLSANCIESNYWINALEKFNIPWFCGASIYDKNALNRMKIIFNSFETMVTNSMGSHVFYAAASGCKIALLNHYIYNKVSEIIYHPHNKNNPHLLTEHSRSFMKLENLKIRFPFLFVHPTEAKQHIGWGNKFLGLENKKSPEEIASLFGWSYEEIQVERYFKMTFDMAHKGLLTREQILREADLALKNNRPKYAKSLLHISRSIG